jgi:transcriptional regulator with XRE-family HTH domain
MTKNDDLSPAAIKMVKATADNFILARKARGLSQEEIAQAIGISLNSYKSLESGEAKANFVSYVKALDYLGLVETLGLLAAPQLDVVGQEYRFNNKTAGRK